MECGRTGDVKEKLDQILGASQEPRFEVMCHCCADYRSGGLAEQIAQFRPCVTFLALEQPITDWQTARKALQPLKEVKPRCRSVVVSPTHSSHQMSLLFDQGASDVWVPPLRIPEAVGRLNRLLCGVHPDVHIQPLKERLGLSQIIGESPALMTELRKIPLVAGQDVNVLIRGETGTGKEVFARAIHNLSQRRHKALVPLNCGAVPVELFENELFGHASGAYTSANSRAIGQIEHADGGTLFLDEVDALPLTAQVKLLRFLEDKSFRPLGAETCHQADVRIIAATNVKLDEAVRCGRFRADLYYRLRVFQFAIPPLRERGQDVLILAQHFLRHLSSDFGKPTCQLSAGAAARLLGHDWAGNVRELQNVLIQALIVSGPEAIEEEDICTSELCLGAAVGSYKAARTQALARFEADYFAKLMAAHCQDTNKAAQAAGLVRRVLQRKLKQSGVKQPF